MAKQSRISILYVDDEEINLLLFDRTFSRTHKVFTAGSGLEGLEILEEYKDEIDVVISDMRMFEMNGIEFISLAKKKHPHKVYFILTGVVFGQEIEEALKKKVIFATFSKPFNKNLIEDAICEAVE